MRTASSIAAVPDRTRAAFSPAVIRTINHLCNRRATTEQARLVLALITTSSAQLSTAVEVFERWSQTAVEEKRGGN
ncbi:MAG: hypothetical protein QM754_10745 [Tepidisphaeraceae bacterium]